MKEIHFYRSKRPVYQIGALSLLMIGVSLFGLGDPEFSQWIVWLIIVIFGVGGPIMMYYLWDSTPYLTLNEIGIRHPTVLNKEVINWEVIEDAYVTHFDAPVICLVVDEEYAPSERKGGFHKLLGTVNKATGAQELNIHLGGVNADPEALRDLILLMTQQKSTPEERKEALQSYQQ